MPGAAGGLKCPFLRASYSAPFTRKGTAKHAEHLLLDHILSDLNEIAWPDPARDEGFADCLPNKDQLVVKVTRKAFAQNLNWNAEIFEATGNLGNAALTYSEIATRLHRINPGKASVARNRAYSTFAAAIKTPINVKVSGFDEKQGIVVLTDEFVNYLKEYQKKKNVPATGVLSQNVSGLPQSSWPLRQKRPSATFRSLDSEWFSLSCLTHVFSALF